ncbi:MAG: hypothetical protein M1591_06805 [Deltaproteobacteria bacterium]|nr:hypothetical protein [Deltaproteobacteria bacterium]MCL5276233.1 hypothetical protein [Deltaproteobacteria bacterium]
MKWLVRLSILLLFLGCATNTYADFYPGVGSDVSFTDQNEIFYTIYGRLGYAPSYRTYMDIGYTHEWDFTQTSSPQQFHIVYADLYHRVGRKWKLGGVANYTFGATPDTNGYYSAMVRPEGRYAITDIVSVGAGPVYYYIYGPGSFIGVFLGGYFCPTDQWWLYMRGTVDTSVNPDVSEQDAALEMGASYNIIKYISVYALYKLSTGITTNPVNNLSGSASSSRGTMGTMAIGRGMGGGMGNGMNNYPSLFTTTISTFTIGLSVTF